MQNAEDAILNAKDKLPNVTPTPPSMQIPQSSAQALKQRLEWGEPAFTILDARERTAINGSRILGAMPMDGLTEQSIMNLERNRDIYIYGETDEQAEQVAGKLRDAGFERVAVLKGGLAAWKAIGGQTEGNAELDYDHSSAEYNVKARLEKHAQVSSKNV